MRMRSGGRVEPVRLVIVGCGGMGRRHLAGLGELARSDHHPVDLVAVCDLNEQNARDLADEALDSRHSARPSSLI